MECLLAGIEKIKGKWEWERSYRGRIINFLFLPLHSLLKYSYQFHYLVFNLGVKGMKKSSLHTDYYQQQQYPPLVWTPAGLLWFQGTKAPLAWRAAEVSWEFWYT